MANTIKLGAGNWATKENEILAYNDENNNFKPLPFDTTRATTATRVNKDGLIENIAASVPRVDYASGDGALLLEPASTNLITYSEDFSNVAWSKPSSATITPNTVISVGGDLNGSNLNFTNVSAFDSLSFSATSLASTYTQSIFVKYVDAQFVQLFFGSTGFTGGSVTFDVLNGVKGLEDGGAVGGITHYGNGWYKIEITKESTSGSTQVLSIVTVTNINATRFNSEANGNVYIFGAQVEEQSSATSYIPTAGTIISRTQDTASKSGISSLINSSEGVFYFEGSALSNGGSNREISLNDGTNTNAITFYYNITSSKMTARISLNSVNHYFETTGINQTDLNKIAIRYSANNYSLWINGVNVAQNTNGGAFALNTLNSLKFSSGSGTAKFEGNCKDLRVFNTALTDAELETLTSYSSFNEMALAQNYIIQ